MKTHTLPHSKGPGPLTHLSDAEHFLKMFLLYARDARGHLKALREESCADLRGLWVRAARTAAASAREFHARFAAARAA